MGNIWQKIARTVDGFVQVHVVVLSIKDWDEARTETLYISHEFRGIPIRGSDARDSFIVAVVGGEPCVSFL